MGHSSSVNTLFLNSEEAELYCGLRGGMIVLWDVKDQKVKINLKGHSTQITSMTIFQNKNSENILASGSADGKIKLWDLKSKIPATNIKGHFSQVDALSFSPDFVYLSSGGQDGVVKLWDVRNTNKTLKEIYEAGQKAVNCIEFNNDLKLAFGGKDKVIRFYDLEEFGKIGQTSPDRLPIQKIAFDNDGKNIISATDESVKYWEINEQGMNLIDMIETGWNKLKSFKYIEQKAICALGSFGNKISYYILKYKELVQNPNLILRENPYMANIVEVKETEDSSNLDSIADKKIMNNSEKKMNNNNFDKNNLKNNKKNNVLENENMDDNLRLSKFISNNISNSDISLSEINTSKIESKKDNIIKNITSKIGNEELSKKPKEKEIKETLDKKNNINYESNIADEQRDKMMIGDISNMSDLSDNKEDLSLGMIVGNDNNNNEVNNNININNKKNNDIFPNNEKKSINENNTKKFDEFNENDIEQFLMNNNIEHNKNLDISEIPSIIGDNEFNPNNDISLFSSVKKSSYSSSIAMQVSNNNNENSQNKKENKSKKLTLDDLSKINYASINNNQNFNTNNAYNDNKSFISLKSDETLGIDITQLIEENGMIKEANQIIPSSEDLPILHEINSQHDKVRATITKRYNGLKIALEYWKKSDLPSALNALRILKDYSVVKDFFYYGIINRGDITKIPLTLDSALAMLPYVYILMKSKIDVYWKTACRAGMIFLKIFMEKIENIMRTKKNVVVSVDKILEENIKKCEEIVKIFRQIYESDFLRKHITEEKNENENQNQNNNLAYAFYTDLEFFLNNCGDKNKIYINNI